MSSEKITLKNNESFIFRKLRVNDSKRLVKFFDLLSSKTRSLFAPHPFSTLYIEKLCSNTENTDVVRFIVENNIEIVGYFIIDFTILEHEIKRYASYGISIEPKRDPYFALCISDKYQNTGIASQAMKYIHKFLVKSNLRSLVLLGGTQESNILAIGFYHKFGFVKCGEFFWEVQNIDMRRLNLEYEEQ